MKISTFRFIVYILASILLMPIGSGNTGLLLIMAYYAFMFFLTLLFMKRDSIHLKFWFPNIWPGVIKGLIAFPILVALNLLMNFLFPEIKNLQSDTSDISQTLFFITAIMIAPVVEEMMFRGYIQEYFRKRLKTEWAIVISALIFSLYHPIQLFPQVLVMGVFLSALREMTGSLIPGMIAHAASNAVAFMQITFSS